MSILFLYSALVAAFIIATTAYHAGAMRALAFAFDTMGNPEKGEECRSIAKRSVWRAATLLMCIIMIVALGWVQL
jgi:hypothetical protein